jgi:hypothetical protein
MWPIFLSLPTLHTFPVVVKGPSWFMIVWLLDLQLPVQSVHITINIVSLNHVRGEGPGRVKQKTI